MFETIRQKYLSDWKNVKWIQEVNIGVGGNVDYVAVEVDDFDVVKDFLCVEYKPQAPPEHHTRMCANCYLPVITQESLHIWHKLGK